MQFPFWDAFQGVFALRVFGEIMNYSRAIEGAQDARVLVAMLAGIGCEMHRDADGVKRILPVADVKPDGRAPLAWRADTNLAGCLGGPLPSRTKAAGV